MGLYDPKGFYDSEAMAAYEAERRVFRAQTMRAKREVGERQVKTNTAIVKRFGGKGWYYNTFSGGEAYGLPMRMGDERYNALEEALKRSNRRYGAQFRAVEKAMDRRETAARSKWVRRFKVGWKPTRERVWRATTAGDQEYVDGVWKIVLDYGRFNNPGASFRIYKGKREVLWERMNAALAKLGIDETYYTQRIIPAAQARKRAVKVLAVLKGAK